MRLKFYNDIENIQKFLSDIQEAADGERDALGFLSSVVYENHMLQNKIIVVVDSQSDTYLGHVMFGRSFPVGRIFQTVVKKDFRKLGIAHKLLNELENILKELQFTSIVAKVAVDLTISNSFYANAGYGKIRVLTKKNQNSRELVLRCKELSEPGLLRTESLNDKLDIIKLPLNSSFTIPCYAIDLNVIFDATKKRRNSEFAAKIISSSLMGEIRLCITNELVSELERTSKGEDPLLAMIKNFEIINSQSQTSSNNLISEIGPIVFKDAHKNNSINQQSHSDLRHLATAIENKVGFLTSDKKILAASNYLLQNHNIDILSVSELSLIVTPPSETQVNFTTDDISIKTSNNYQDPIIINVINELKIDKKHLPRIDDTSENRIKNLVITNHNGVPLAYSWWTSLSGVMPENKAFLFINNEAPNINLLADFICNKICSDVSKKDVAIVRLEGNFNNIDVLESVKRNGFSVINAVSNNNSLAKICIGFATLATNWPKIRHKIMNLSDRMTILPENPINFSEMQDVINVQNQHSSTELTIREFERSFSPTLYSIGNVNGVIVPISGGYSRDLFGDRNQLSWLDTKEALLKSERVYFCTPNAISRLSPGSIIFFYESASDNGHMEIIAAARINSVKIALVNEISEELLLKGVVSKNILEKQNKNKRQSVVHFNDIIMMRTPISFKKLGEIGCADGANFVTAKKITSKQTISILKAGTSNDG